MSDGRAGSGDGIEGQAAARRIGGAAGVGGGGMVRVPAAGWVGLGVLVGLAASAMLGSAGTQVPKTVPAIVTADTNAYLVTGDHRVFYLRGNTALEVVGLPSNWR